jgi:hypothetical protein
MATGRAICLNMKKDFLLPVIQNLRAGMFPVELQERVLGHCDQQTLLGCRQVSRLWYDMAERYLEKRSYLLMLRTDGWLPIYGRDPMIRVSHHELVDAAHAHSLCKAISIFTSPHVLAESHKAWTEYVKWMVSDNSCSASVLRWQIGHLSPNVDFTGPVEDPKAFMQRLTEVYNDFTESDIVTGDQAFFILQETPEFLLYHGFTKPAYWEE